MVLYNMNGIDYLWNPRYYQTASDEFIRFMAAVLGGVAFLPSKADTPPTIIWLDPENGQL